ncbi:MAG: CapA family protein [Cyanobacteriota bacterium]|nr:CapA family protein [Cyanobacteriota bacterium]
MISAVIPPHPPLPVSVPGSEKSPPSLRELAAAGHFRSIALWLNQPLAPQGIFVQVQPDRPGCLKLIVEFQRSPLRDRLVRFLCHRIWQLNSELIEGIYILVRPIGWQRPLWHQRVKIVTPALKRRQAAAQFSQAIPVQASLPPRLRAVSRPGQLSHRRRFKVIRAFMLSGSAVAAFMLGCWLEVLTSPSPALPVLSAKGPSTPIPSPDSAESVTVTGADPLSKSATDRPTPNRASLAPSSAIADPVVQPRPKVVDTALEPVGVIPYNKAGDGPADEVNLLFGGDISLDTLDYAQLQGEGGFFADVEDYGQADISMVNLATPLATAATSLNEELYQRTRTDAVDLLAESGIDLVNLTSSTLMNYGAEGLSQTLTALDSKGLYRVGAGRNAMEARRPEILDVKGKRIAYLSYAMGGNNAAIDTSALKERAGAQDATIAKELENFKKSTAFKERPGFNAQGMPEIVADLKALRDQVDWIVVNFRWVDHLQSEPNFVQTNLARLAIDQGADVVVGYHPTVIQGGEIYKGRPIAYSLGDFVFKGDQPIADQNSAMLKVSLRDDQMQVEFVPVQVRDSRPKTLTGSEGEAVLQRLQAASAQFDQPLRSSMVLDLQNPAKAPTEALDPTSPFVTPETPTVLPVKSTNPALDQPAVDGASPTPEPKQPQSEQLNPDLSLPSGDLQKQMTDQLQEWGPKVSPQQQQFQPIPHNRSGVSEQSPPSKGDLDQLKFGREQAQDRSVPPQSSPGQSWTDQVPSTPIPPSPIPAKVEPLVGPVGQNVTPDPSIEETTASIAQVSLQNQQP